MLSQKINNYVNKFYILRSKKTIRNRKELKILTIKGIKYNKVKGG